MKKILKYTTLLAFLILLFCKLFFDVTYSGWMVLSPFAVYVLIYFLGLIYMIIRYSHVSRTK